MKKNKIITSILCILSICLIAFTPQFTAFAEQKSDIKLQFALKTDDYFAEKDDVITVSFEINRTDSDEKYTISSFQNIIRYDNDYFELVDGSIFCYKGEATKKIDTEGNVVIQCANVFNTAEYSSTLVCCTFQLKVIATAGNGTVDNGKVDEGTEVYAFDAENKEVMITKQSLTIIYGTGCSHTGKTEIKAKAASCTEKGWNAHYICNGCPAVFDIDGQTQLPDIPYLPISHSFDDKLSFDENGHWYQCSLCEEKSEYAAHAGGTATCENKAICSDCGQEYGDIDTNNHSSETIIKNHKITWFFGNGYSGDIHCADCGEMIEKGETVSMYNVMAWPLWVWVLAILFLPVVLGGWRIVWMLGVISTFIL